MSETEATNGAANNQTQLDAVILGAGFAGLYFVHKLRDEQGLNVRGFDKAGDVGGTWYWNRYPGARSDTESFVYSYSFDKELLQDWTWSDRYPKQPEVLSYLEHVADRFDLRRSFSFETKVTKAHFNEDTNRWDIETDKGEKISAKFFITGLGLLSAQNIPAFKGLESFEGEQYHTGNWPLEKVDFKGKRVGVIGTGSTGVQVVTALGPEVGHLTVFQRSPQYSVPARAGAMPDNFIEDVKANYDQVWDDVRGSVVAFGFEESAVEAMSVSEEERQRVFEDAWAKGGGFRYMFGTFCDIASSREANEEAAKFVRKKIAGIVKDPATADKLTPTDLYAKRPLCDAGYFETYNRDNVELVDVKKSPIEEITPKGVRTADNEYELDILIFATGFDAVSGNFVRIDIRGKDGIELKDKWSDGPSSYLGMTNSGFPNMFMALGPNGPFTNQPPAIEAQVEWITDAIKYTGDKNVAAIEATPEAEAEWSATCNEIANMTLFPEAESWIFGANIPGKPNVVMFYMAGLGAYRQVCNESAENDYAGFSKTS